MKQITRLTMTLALLIMAVTGAWAQNDEPTVTWDPATKTGTFTMPAIRREQPLPQQGGTGRQD